MKTFCLIVVLQVLTFADVYGQVFDQSGAMALSPAASSVTERGRHFKVIESVRQATNQLGQTVLKTNRFTALGNSMNFKDENGNWVESHPAVHAFSGGVACEGAGYRVILNTNLNTDGAVDFMSSQQQRIVSHPLAIYYFDPDSGRSALLAQIKDTGPEILSSTEVVYRDAFDGNGIQAGIIYRFRAGAFQQNVVFVKRPSLTPVDLGMGSRTRIEVASEILDCPAPTRTLRVLKKDASQAEESVLTDEVLDFGNELRMGLGHAFGLGEGINSFSRGIPVAKRLVQTTGGRTLLLEAVEWNAVRERLEKLQVQATGVGQSDPQVNIKRELPARRVASGKLTPFENRFAQIIRSRPVPSAVAKATSRPNLSNGFVIDYTIVDSYLSSYTFASGETYLIENQTWIDDATFESGCTVKFSRHAGLSIGNSVTCPAGSPRAVLTAVDDDLVGDDIDGLPSMPVAFYAWAALDLEYLPSGVSLSYLDFRYAAIAVNRYGSYDSDQYSNCRFGNCELGIYDDSVYITLSPVETCNIGLLYSATGGTVWVYNQSENCGYLDPEGDGLGDAWEIHYFGNLTNSPTGDADGDGLTNLQEYQGGTDPTTNDFPGCVSLTNNPGAWWAAEGNANDIIGTNNGTFYGASYSTGRIGRTFDFDGSSYIAVPSGPAVAPTNAFTVEGWINYRRTTDEGGACIISKGVDAYTAVDWTMTVSANYRFRPAAKVGSTWCYFDCGPYLNPGTWYHVAMVYDGSWLKGYINGVIGGSNALSGTLQCTSYPLKIGAYAPTNGYTSKAFFVGRIDELSIYNRALSGTEIQAIYAAASSGKCFDRDGDGLPDDWEMKYFHNLDQGAGNDPDSDGYTNLEEYQNNTDPRAYNSQNGLTTANGLQVFKPLK